MKFARIETAIALAKKETLAIAAIDPQLNSFVVGYLIVDVISEFEQRLEAMFVLRARKLNDGPNTNFVTSSMARRLQSPAATKIHEMLKAHHIDFYNTFATQLAPSKYMVSLSNLLTARQYFAHKQGSPPPMTLQDVEKDYLEAVKMFDALAVALGLTPADCAHFI